MFVRYECCLPLEAQWPVVVTVVVCDRQGSGWRCDENELEEFAARNLLPMRWTQNGAVDDSAAAEIIRFAMARRK